MKIETDKQNILAPEEMLDTTALQIKSLRAFMQALDYEWAADTAIFDEPLYFESYAYKNKARKNISFENAVKLHNGCYTECHGRGYNCPFNFDPYSVAKAEASKIVRSIKLQMDKRTGYVKTQSHLVEFVSPLYYKMFINNPKYSPF